MDWELLKKIDPKKLIGERLSPFDLMGGGDQEKVKPSKDKPLTGLYYRKPGLVYEPSKGLSCAIEFLESQESNRFQMGLLKSMTIGSAERHFAESCKYVAKNKPQKALSKLGDVLNKDPQHTDAYFLMGCILMEAEQFDKANSCFHKVLLCQKSLGKGFKKYLPSFHITLNLNLSPCFCIYPELLGATLLVAISYWENNKREEAISALDQTVSIFPKNSAVLYLMTFFRLEMARYKAVIEELSDFEPSNSLDLATYTLLGIALYSSHDPVTAVQVLKNAIRFAERFEEEGQIKIIRYNLGRAYLNKGDKFEGLQELKKVSIIEPDYLDVNHILQDPSKGAKPYAGLRPDSETSVILNGKKVEKSPSKEVEIIDSSPSSPSRTEIPETEAPEIKTPEIETITPESVELSPETDIKEITVGTARLLLQQTGETFSIKINGMTTIGRESSNDISFPEDFSISRRQAKIISNQEGFFAEDLGSTNGTYLNKRRITRKMALKNNDEIQIGKKNFTFVTE